MVTVYFIDSKGIESHIDVATDSKEIAKSVAYALGIEPTRLFHLSDIWVTTQFKR